MVSEGKDKSFTLQCHCQKNTFSFTVPSSDLPLSSYTCHCSTCRHTRGTLAVFHAQIPSTPSPDPRTLQLKDLASYRASKDSEVAHYFCPTCGSHLVTYAEDDGGDWFISTGLVEGGDESVFAFGDAAFVPDSVDGGASDWLPAGTRKWSGFVDESDLLRDHSWKQAPSSEIIKREASHLPVRCHCGGVSFTIRKPDFTSPAFRADCPGLEPPPEDPAERDAKKEEEDGTWWFACDRTKYIAGACLCTSCRLSTGCELMDWAFVPTTFITLDDGAQFRTEFGTLRAFESSPNVFRRFCSTCGALVFWQDMVERPNVIDVAIGVIDSETGARAEEWLEWRKKGPTFAEDAVNKTLAVGLTEGYRAWVDQRWNK